MKTVWKWILGIVLGLVVLALILGAVFMARSHMVLRAFDRDVRGFGWDGRGYGMMPFGMYSMHGFGMMPFGGIFGGLLSLGFLALVVMGIIWLVRSLRRPVHVETPVVNPAVVTPPAATHACPKCGNPVQEDWKHCPNCGKKQ